MKKVLVTSSTGMTGRSVVKHLAKKGLCVRAMIHSAKHKEGMLALGAAETVIASIDKDDDMSRAMTGIDTVFYICPTAHNEEGRIGCHAVELAEKAGIQRFIYQSVHNSIEPDLPHHRQKLMVEQRLLESSLDYTILRPAAFMQNILASSGSIKEASVFSQRFFTSENSTNLINLIDVDDYGEIAAKIVAGKDYSYGCYDLCGSDNLSAKAMLEIMGEVVGKTIRLHYITDEDFTAQAYERGMSESKLATLQAMFHSYNKFGFKGNCIISTLLLGHRLKDFKSFLAENLK